MAKKTADRPTALSLLREATQAASSSVFEHPRKIPGVRIACLSPLEALSLMRVERPCLDVNDVDVWMSEADVETVHTDGIEFGGETYWHEDLGEVTTGDKVAPGRKYFIRYDRSLFARGILKEVHFFERTRSGNRFVCTCGLRRDVLSRLPEADKDRLLKHRADFAKTLRHCRDLSQQQLMQLEAGHAVLEQHLRDLEARRKRQQSTRREPIVAEPIIELTSAERELARKQEEEQRMWFGAGHPRSNKKESGTAHPLSDGAATAAGEWPGSSRSVPSVLDILNGRVGIEQEE